MPRRRRRFPMPFGNSSLPGLQRLRNAPLYQGPLVRYSLVRSGPAGDDIRVEVTTGIAGYLALYQVDTRRNRERVYPGQ